MSFEKCAALERQRTLLMLNSQIITDLPNRMQMSMLSICQVHYVNSH